MSLPFLVTSLRLVNYVIVANEKHNNRLKTDQDMTFSICLCVPISVLLCPFSRWCGSNMSPPPRAAVRPARCPTTSTRSASMAGGSAACICLSCCSSSSWWSTSPSPSGSSGWCGSTRYAWLLSAVCTLQLGSFLGCIPSKSALISVGLL